MTEAADLATMSLVVDGQFVDELYLDPILPE